MRAPGPAPPLPGSVPVWLAPAIGGVLVFAGYRLIYDALAINGLRLGIGDWIWTDRRDGATPADLLARLSWGMTALLLLIVWAVAVVWMLVSIHQALRTRHTAARRGWLAVATVLAAGVMIRVGTGDPLTLPPVLPALETAFDRLGLAGGLEILSLWNGMGAAAALLLVFGLCTNLAARPAEDAAPADHLKDQQRRARHLLYAGAAVLVTSVIQTAALHRLPLAFLDAAGQESMLRLAKGVASAQGGLWTLLLLGIFLPSAYVLHRQALHLARDLAPGADPQSWLAEQGLATSIRQQLGSLSAMLSPFLAGGLPVLDLLKGLGGG